MEVDTFSLILARLFNVSDYTGVKLDQKTRFRLFFVIFNHLPHAKTIKTQEVTDSEKH